MTHIGRGLALITRLVFSAIHSGNLLSGWPSFEHSLSLALWIPCIASCQPRPILSPADLGSCGGPLFALATAFSFGGLSFVVIYQALACFRIDIFGFCFSFCGCRARAGFAYLSRPFGKPKTGVGGEPSLMSWGANPGIVDLPRGFCRAML